MCVCVCVPMGYCITDGSQAAQRKYPQSLESGMKNATASRRKQEKGIEKHQHRQTFWPLGDNAPK